MLTVRIQKTDKTEKQLDPKEELIKLDVDT